MSVPRFRQQIVPRTALAVLGTAVLLSGCTANGTTKAGGKPAAVRTAGITVRFASGDQQPYDVAFARDVAALSGGTVKIDVLPYDHRAPSVDPRIGKDLAAGRIDVADIASRAWVRLGVTSFTAYQDPFLVTSRELLDAAVQPPVAPALLKSLMRVGVTGLAIAPRSVRYLFSTRPLTTPGQFHDTVVHTNDDPLADQLFTALGATTDTTIEAGVPTRQALLKGMLTGVESDVQSARVNDYVSAAPYVLVGAPLFAKTTTFAASTARLKALGPRVAGWLEQAAKSAAAGASRSLNDQAAWAGACAAGLKPQQLRPTQLDALRAAELPVYNVVAATPPSTLAVDRIGLLATESPRLDSWTLCGATTPSPTGDVDGTYTTRITRGEVRAVGDCETCGNDGDYTITIRDGRYALEHPPPPDQDPNEPSVAATAGWRRGDPIEVGSVVLTGDRALFRPDVGTQYGAGPASYTFQAFRGHLRWSAGSGLTWEVFTAKPWTKKS